MMKTSQSEKYLGDLISSSLNNKSIIADRKNAGIGFNAQIMSLLNDISLGSHYFEIAKILREAMLINGILFNADAWYDLKETDIECLEKVDESLLRKVLKAHSKTAIESLYLELGCKPLRFHLKSKRINFLRYILNLDENDLLYRFFKTQLKFPVKGDWCNTVKDDLKDLDIDLTFDQIKEMKKIPFKKLVRKKANEAALKYLNNLKNTHSKLDNLTFNKLQIQPYLNTRTIYPPMAQQIFKWRTRMAMF